MKKTAHSRSYSPGVNPMVSTIAQLYQDGVAEGRIHYLRGTTLGEDWEEQVLPGSVIKPEVGFPSRTNPFEGTIIAFDKSMSKLTILLGLGKPVRVVAELYSFKGKFIKRLFDKKMEQGLTEIICLGCGRQKDPFVVVLNSGEGMKAFRVRNTIQPRTGK